MGERPIIWTPTARQAAALRSPVLDLFYGGGRGGGKTDFLLADWIGCASAQPGCTGLLVRRTLPELDDVQRRALELYPSLGATYKAQARDWHFPGGAILRMRYLESLPDAARYQGHQYQWIGVDEGGNYPKPDVIDLLRGCLRSSRGHRCYLRITGNPGGPGHDWLKARYITPAKPGTPHTDPLTGIQRVFVPSLLTDNPHITDQEAYVRNLQGAGAAHLVRAWLHGDWDVLPNGGVIDPAKINHGTPPTTMARRYLGVDGAFSDDAHQDGDETAITSWALEGDPMRDPAGVRHWILGQEAARWSITQAADAIMRWIREVDPVTVFIEGGPSGLSLEAVLKERMDALGAWWDIELVSHAGSKVAKAAPLADLIGVGRVWADKTSAWWPAFRDQCTVFDGSDGRKDDRVDSPAAVARALRKLMGNAPPKEKEAPRPARQVVPVAQRAREAERRANPLAGQVRHSLVR